MFKTRKQLIPAVVFILTALAAIIFWSSKNHSRKGPTQPEKIAATVSQINQVNAGLPEPQVQAKTLIMTAMIQKAIPPAANWCETLNAGNKLWPVTPTNTLFALNSQVAGRAYARGIRGDTVVFFETARAGWNQAGGVELLAAKTDGVAVALMDGRALIMSHDEAARLVWAPQ